MYIVFASFKHVKLSVSIKTFATILYIVYICMTGLSDSRTTILLNCYLRSCNNTCRTNGAKEYNLNKHHTELQKASNNMTL